MVQATAIEKTLWRLIVVGGHTRSIGKTQLVCDVIRAFPECGMDRGESDAVRAWGVRTKRGELRLRAHGSCVRAGLGNAVGYRNG